MFQRKLDALGYERRHEVNVREVSTLRPLLCWLEDQKVRQLTVEQRSWLRDESLPEAQWCARLDEYLAELEAPVGDAQFASMGQQQRQETLDWLLRRAVALEYHDNAQEIRSKGASTTAYAGAGTLDFESPEFTATLEEARAAVGVEPSGNTLLVLKAVVRELIYRAREAGNASGDGSHQGSSAEALEERLQYYPLGFTTGDAVLDRFAVGLRLLYVSDIRELQSQVDELIVAMQECTANPKTNSSLGRVGR